MIDSDLSTEVLLKQCSIRVSNRAKYLRLSVSLHKGIEVVVPASLSKKQAERLVPQFLSEKENWLKNTLNQLQQNKTSHPLLKPCEPPDVIYLKAMNKTFPVDYRRYNHSCLRLEATADERLIIYGKTEHRPTLFKLLENYFKKYAYAYLAYRLDILTEQTGLSYGRLSVRAQKTRWGSCSSKKNISLNYKLIFLEQDLVDYVLLHELAHTQYLNHSKAFWELLGRFMPDYRERDKEVNKAMASLPCWAI